MSRFLPLLAVLSAAEVIALSLAFDLRPLSEKTGWVGLLGAGGGLVPLLFIVPVVLTILRDSTLHEVAGQLNRARVTPRRAVAAWCAHAGAFGAFVVGTHLLVTMEAPSALHAGLWILAAPAVPVVTWWVARPRVRLRPVLIRAAPAIGLGVGIAVFVWGMGMLSSALWHALYPIVLIPVHALLKATLTDVVYEPGLQNVGTTRFLVNVAPVCSGLEGLGLLVSLAVLILVFYRPAGWSWRHGALFILAAAFLSWFANVVRICTLVAIGDAGFEKVAIGGFHSKAGWLLYALVGIGMLWFVARRDRAPGGRPRETAEGASTPGRSVPAVGADVFVGPVLIFTATGLLTSLATETTFDPLYGLRAIAGAVALFGAYRIGRRRGFALSDPGPSGAPLVAILIGISTYGVWLMLAPGPLSPAVQRGLAGLSADAAAVWVMLRLFGHVCVVPWVEELAFRGYLMRRLSDADFVRVPYARLEFFPVVLSAVAFGALHQAFVAGAVAGIMFALAQSYGRRVQDAVIAHATTNALLAVHAILEAAGV